MAKLIEITEVLTYPAPHFSAAGYLSLGAVGMAMYFRERSRAKSRKEMSPNVLGFFTFYSSSTGRIEMVVHPAREVSLSVWEKFISTRKLSDRQYLWAAKKFESVGRFRDSTGEPPIPFDLEAVVEALKAQPLKPGRALSHREKITAQTLNHARSTDAPEKMYFPAIDALHTLGIVEGLRDEQETITVVPVYGASLKQKQGTQLLGYAINFAMAEDVHVSIGCNADGFHNFRIFNPRPPYHLVWRASHSGKPNPSMLRPWSDILPFKEREKLHCLLEVLVSWKRGYSFRKTLPLCPTPNREWQVHCASEGSLGAIDAHWGHFLKKKELKRGEYLL
jgi:hypothetical protein